MTTNVLASPATRARPETLGHLFPYLPKQPGYNKRLRALTPQLAYFIAALATDTDLWQHPSASPTPPRCRAAPPAKLSTAPSWPAGPGTATVPPTPAGSGAYACTWHHRARPARGVRLASPKADERDVLVDLVSLQPAMFHRCDGMILIVDKGYRDRATETWLNEANITVVRPAYRTEPTRPSRALLRAVRQNIESVNDTLKDQLDLERHGGRTSAGVAVRVLQRILALTATICHNWYTGHAVPDRVRPLTPWN